MKKSLWTRLLSLLLAVVLCVELLPAVGSAVSPSEDLEHTVEGTVEEPAEVAFEEASLRGERVKHFRMGDGSYVAVQYDVPVHHRDADGRWQDIDNTLEPVGQTYAVEDGSVAFAASLNASTGCSSSWTVIRTSCPVTMQHWQLRSRRRPSLFLK